MTVDLKYAFGLPPEKAIEYFKAKGYAVSWDWYDTLAEAHARAFTVAKAMRMDVLGDIRGALDQSLQEGLTLGQFKKDLTPRLQAKGWWGKQWMGDKEGAVEVQLGSPYRLATIYRTNMQTAYMAARYKELLDNAEDRPYWQWVAVMDNRTRPAHRLLNGKIFRWDDPFWDSHWPPLGFNCRCRVRALNGDNIAERNLTVESSQGKLSVEDRLVSMKTGELSPVTVYTDPKTGTKIAPDVGWSYNPGQAWQIDATAYQKAQGVDPEIRSRFIGDMVRARVYQDMFSSFVDGVMERGQVRGLAATVGWMDEEVSSWVKARDVEPKTPIIVATDKGVLHMRDKLPLEEIKRIPGYIRDPEAVLWDKKDPALLYVVRGEGKKIKTVVRINYREKKEIINPVVTSGRVQAENLRDPRYEVIKGKL